MRGFRDVLLVAAVAVATVALGMIGAGIRGSTPGFTATHSITAGSAWRRAGAGEGEHQRPEGALSPAGAAIGESHRLASRSGTPPERWRGRYLSVAASPEANDLRTFLNTMARATRDGNAIGILGQDSTPAWMDDEAKGDH